MNPEPSDDDRPVSVRAGDLWHVLMMADSAHDEGNYSDPDDAAVVQRLHQAFAADLTNSSEAVLRKLLGPMEPHSDAWAIELVGDEVLLRVTRTIQLTDDEGRHVHRLMMEENYP